MFFKTFHLMGLLLLHISICLVTGQLGVNMFKPGPSVDYPASLCLVSSQNVVNASKEFSQK